MSAFDFDSIVDRRHTDSYKWDTTPDGVTPMWVADMDFRTAPCIIEALRRRVDHGVFGYTAVPKAYYDAVCKWMKRRHQWDINPGHIIYTTGVVPAVSAVIKAVTRPGDSVIVQSPVYNCFYSSIRNNDCHVVDNQLIYTADGYTIDFGQLEKLAARPEVTAMVLCNPHNPAGRVWTADELRRIADICLRNDVFVISDEIHCELVYKPYEYTPYGTLGEDFAAKSAVCFSPSKAFNTAGLQIANIVCADEQYRRAIDKAININEVCDVNPFGVVATIAAYNEGEPWLDALTDYLAANRDFLESFVAEHLPGFNLVHAEATYLGWLDISPTGMSSEDVEKILIERANVRFSAGSVYGKGGENFVRINFACPRRVLEDAMARVAPELVSLSEMRNS